MKISIWTCVFLAASGMALTGCQQAPKTNAPCPTCNKQTDRPIQAVDNGKVIDDDGKVKMIIPGMSNAPDQTIVITEPGNSNMPIATHPGSQDMVLPLPDGTGPRITEISMGNAPNQAIPASLPPTNPGNSDWSSSGSAPRIASPLPPAMAPAGTSMYAPTTISAPMMATQSPAPMQTIPAQGIQAFSHSDDYRVLTGQVLCWRQTWKLRYADFGTMDPFGGSVVLEGGRADGLQDGCQVRVTGRLIPPAERGAAARFQVQSMQIIEH